MKKLYTIIFAILFTFLLCTPSMAFLGNDVDIDIDSHDKTCITNKVEQEQNQKQQQTQVQGQLQGQTQSAHNEGVKQKVVFEQAETKRDFLAPTKVEYAKPGVYKEPSKYGAEFTAFKDLTRYKKRFSYEHALTHYGKPYGRGKCITIGGSYNGRHEKEPTKFVEVITDEQVNMNTMEPIGFLTIKTNPKWKKKWFVKAADKEVDSFVVLQKAILSACTMQGNYIMKVREGATFESWNRGRGIGWNTSGGIVNDNSRGRGRAGSTSGGTGWSEGEAGNDTLPWLVVQVFKKK